MLLNSIYKYSKNHCNYWYIITNKNRIYYKIYKSKKKEFDGVMKEYRSENIIALWFRMQFVDKIHKIVISNIVTQSS